MNTRFAAVVMTLLALSSFALADDAALKKVVKDKVNAMNEATLKGDWAKLADLQHTRVLQGMGGRENMIVQTDKVMKKMKEGIEIKSFKLGEPSAIVKQDTDLYVYVPNEMTTKLKGGRLISKSYVVGVSPDQGKTWTFVTSDSKGSIRKIFPNLPDALKLPETKPPVAEKD